MSDYPFSRLTLDPAWKPGHQPKGSMCLACQHSQRDCKGLPFSAMPVIATTPDAFIVKCAEFVKRAD